MRRLEFTVRGRPVSKNAAFTQRANGRGVCLSKAAVDFISRVQAWAIVALGSVRCPFDRNVAVVVTSHFTRKADSGASIALVKDALQGFAYRNDAVVVFEASFQGLPDKANPRTEITVWELDGQAASVRVPIPADCAADFGERTKTARAAALDLRQKSDAFEARSRVKSSAKSYRTPEKMTLSEFAASRDPDLGPANAADAACLAIGDVYLGQNPKARYRTPEGDPWADPGSTTKIPDEV